MVKLNSEDVGQRKRIFLGVFLWLVLVCFLILLPLLPIFSSKTIDPVFLRKANSDTAVVFFGFPKCHGVCPTAMATLARWYQHSDSALDVGVYFINIDSGSNRASTQVYALGFHESFIGIYPSEDELEALIQQFGLNIAESGGDMDHRGRSYLLKREEEAWRLVSAINSQGLTEDVLNRLL